METLGALERRSDARQAPGASGGVKFLIDVQLPRRFAIWLAAQGHDAKHTLNLPLGNRTPDSDIIAL